VTLHHLDNAIDALALLESMLKETQSPIVVTNRATGQVLSFEELRRLANLERSRARRS
jgi:threonine aldolase